MTVFKTYLKVLNKNRWVILMYAVIILVFAGFNMKTSDNNLNFTAAIPDIYILNNDIEGKITKDLISYISKHANIKDIKSDDESIKDALFYRDVNYIITIPKNFHVDFLSHKNPEIEIKTTKDYPASLANILLEDYLTTANIYNHLHLSESELIAKINESLKQNVEVSITSTLDSNSLNQATFYFNFTNYCFLASCIFIICLILSSFRNTNIKKRTIISSMNYQKFNQELFFSNALFAFILWFFYLLLSFILVGSVMFSAHGVLYLLNSFIFMLCTLSLAFLLGNLVSNKEALNGIVNVIALGSSFLCGAFVPVEYLPTSVLNIAHIFPSYWFIKNNNLIKGIETFNKISLRPFFINIGILIFFMLIFIILMNIISSKKRKIAY